MLSKTMLTIFYGGAYAWFCIGFLLIAIPAIKVKELTDKKEIAAVKELTDK